MTARANVDRRARVPDSGAPRSRRLKTRLAALAASALAAFALSAGSAQAATVTVFPDDPPHTANCYPFGVGSPPNWLPFAAFIYQNIPSFELSTGDTLAFDLAAVNDADIQLDIALARTTVNGGNAQAEPFKNVVTDNQTPENPRGDTTVGNFDLRYTAEAPFSFPGGGLIIRFSDPSPAYQADTTCTGNLVSTSASDLSAFFVQRAFRDANGVAPWDNLGTARIGAFQVVTTDPAPPEPPPDPVPPPDNGAPPPDNGAPPPAGEIFNDFTFGRAKKNKKRGTAKLTVKNLPGPGELELAKNKKVKGKEKTADAGKEKLPIKPKRRAKKRLNKKGKTKVRAKVTFTPDGGEPNTKTKKLKLKKR